MCRLFIFFVFVSAKVVAAPALLSGNCDQLRGQDRHDCELDFEVELIKKHNKYFERKDGVLVLKTKKGDGSQSFRDEPSRSWKEHGAHYRVIAFYPDKLISHIRVSGYEYFQSFAFHHAYGDKEDVLWKTVVSPSADLLVGFSADLEANWKQNGVAVYSISNWGLEPLVSYYPTAFGIKGVKFISPFEMELITICHSKNWKAQGPYGEGRARLKFDDSVWQIGQISCGE